MQTVGNLSDLFDFCTIFTFAVLAKKVSAPSVLQCAYHCIVTRYFVRKFPL
ncbi:hypothetical protein Plhal304r1_c068g0156131 [Plasmopara halstedii]